MCEHRMFECKIPLLARRTRPKGRPSAARDDSVSCIQIGGLNIGKINANVFYMDCPLSLNTEQIDTSIPISFLLIRFGISLNVRQYYDNISCCMQDAFARAQTQPPGQARDDRVLYLVYKISWNFELDPKKSLIIRNLASVC